MDNQQQISTGETKKPRGAKRVVVDGKRRKESSGRVRTRLTKAGVAYYTAQYRPKGGKARAQSFATDVEAEMWLKKQDLAAGTSAGSKKKNAAPEGMRLVEVFALYEKIMELNKHPLGQRVAQQLDRMSEDELLKNVLMSQLEEDPLQVLMPYFRGRMERDGVAPSTNLQDYVQIDVATKRVGPDQGWGARYAPCGEEIRGALRLAKLIAPSKERERRPSPEELAKLLTYFAGRLNRTRKGVKIPMADIIAFATLNAFRQGEIFELRWSDLKGSAVWCWRKDSESKQPGTSKRRGKTLKLVPLLEQALEIALRQPRIEGEERIFPFDGRVIGQIFTRACFALKITNREMERDDRLHFHDLRHEAISTLATRIGRSQAMQITGHKSPKNFDRYVNLEEEAQQTAEMASAAMKVRGHKMSKYFERMIPNVAVNDDEKEEVA